MNFFRLYLKNLLCRKQVKGFTLTELLVAIAISGLVLSGLGAGLVAVLNSNKDSTVKTDVKNQLNRAIDYINDDIARSRVAGASTPVRDTLILNYFTTEAPTVSNTIEYQLTASTDTDPWLGPNILRRRVNGGDWQVLVDGLTENNVSSELTCNDPNGLIGSGGFQACIETGTATNGTAVYRVRVGLFGELFDTEGTDTSSETLSVLVDTIARSITPTVSPPNINLVDPVDLTPELSWPAINGADNYRIYSCTTTDVTCTPIPGTDPQDGSDISGAPTGMITHQTVTAAADGERVCFTGVSISSGTQSVTGNVACTILNPTAVPTAISSSDLVVTPDIVPEVSWSRDTSAVDYYLYRCPTLDPSSPCTITVTDPTTDPNVVLSFRAPTDTAFDANIPWNETQDPPANQAFCYGVVAGNEEGYSTAASGNISPVKCGALNVGETVDSTWDIQFISFDTTVTNPQGVTWTNASPDAIKYQIRKCEIESNSSCNPETDGDLVLNGNPSPLSFNEGFEPDPGKKFCYQVRAIGVAGRVSPYSSPEQCGAAAPPLCTLDLNALGRGAVVAPKSTSTLDQRNDLIEIVTNAGFAVPTTVNNSPVFAPFLDQVSADGIVQGGQDSVDLSCDTVIKFEGYWP
ncbi:prepilin-type N-terminal cleavage/methylation domain-containing protein [[Limnothrix rosea] IAM M-220]|uniref:prepilin-type N-terminal cleavage/methylation domain-containing protein n=1 Tax=[Limnothrix rosea] IAM M-220 TaxID=454133 RepID=UPI00096862AF|nr:prepilin-type N-terminal cleavage/methylation domain-containing protein [[Limnothrix rosea] IAM M-220]OKH11606.1 hypothetical protein NIES208_17055 [[Limnothrix rosea] IAM M-220]